MSEYSQIFPAKKILPDGRASRVEVSLPKEIQVELALNGKVFTTLFVSPGDLRELAVGHLVTERLVPFEKIEEIEVEGNRVDVRTVNSGPERGLEKCPFVSSEAVFDFQVLFLGIAFLESAVYRETRGTHLAALVDLQGKLVVQIVDVGRHNAVDKAVGYALLNGLPLSEMYLLSTGRQPEYMVLKAARAGIPLVVTKAVPFDSGVEAAKKTNVGLVGRLSENSMLVFANEWRVRK